MPLTDGLGAEDGAEQRILGVVLEVPAVAHIAGEVDAAGPALR
jgi:hypothetical protein